MQRLEERVIMSICRKTILHNDIVKHVLLKYITIPDEIKKRQLYTNKSCILFVDYMQMYRDNNKCLEYCIS